LPACPQLEPTAYKTLTGNKLQDQQAVLLVPKGQRVQQQQQQQQQQPGAGAAKSASPPVLMLGTSSGSMAASPLRLGSPRVYGGSAASPMSPLSRSFDRVRGLSCRLASRQKQCLASCVQGRCNRALSWLCAESFN
jgi:hypothetical protein